MINKSDSPYGMRNLPNTDEFRSPMNQKSGLLRYSFQKNACKNFGNPAP